MTILQTQSFEAIRSDVDIANAYPFPEWLASLDVRAIESLRRPAQEYADKQRSLADQEEAYIAGLGITVEKCWYDDPFSNPTDRAFIDTIVECMVGMRLALGDKFVYKGNRTKGPDSPLTEGFKSLSPAMTYWRDNLVPTSAALAVLYNPHLPVMPVISGVKEGDFTPWQKNDAVSSAVFAESLDGRAIRSRGETVKHALLEQFLDTNRYPEGSEIRIASLACGAAEVIFGATAELTKQRADLKIVVNLVDSDSSALDRAKVFAESQPALEGVLLNFFETNILRGESLDDVNTSTNGEGFDFVDVVGFLEYLPTRVAEMFIKNAYSLVRERGMLCAANMRTTHSQLEFTTNCVRWPYIVPRSLRDITDIIRNTCSEEPAGLTIKLPLDGGYAVVCIRKD